MFKDGRVGKSMPIEGGNGMLGKENDGRDGRGGNGGRDIPKPERLGPLKVGKFTLRLGSVGRSMPIEGGNGMLGRENDGNGGRAGNGGSAIPNPPKFGPFRVGRLTLSDGRVGKSMPIEGGNGIEGRPGIGIRASSRKTS